VNKNISNIIDNILPISLKEMDDVSLMKRTDTKFIIPENKLQSVLTIIKDQYKILEINKNRIMSYSSLYFDTNTKKFYQDHHNGKNNRIKVRMRKYLESDICFFEIKQKDGKGKTTKSRIEINDFDSKLHDEYIDFIETKTSQRFDLIPIISNKFNRITLVNNTEKERLTIDLNLSFTKNESIKEYNNLVIIEVKQEKFNRNSPVIKALKNKGINPFRISKYCIGMISLYKDLKYNRFKEKLIKINKITSY